MNLEFTKTIRFRLALWSSLILFLLSGVFVLGINIYLNQLLKETPQLRSVPQLRTEVQQQQRRDVFEHFEELAEEEQERIRDIRLNDLQNIREISILSLFPLALVSFILGYYASGQFLQPLNTLNTAIAELQADNLNQQLTYHDVDDEVGTIIKSFNDMSSRLHSAFEQQQQFVQDASHELKTPLAVIQTNLDTTLADDKATTAELRKSIDSALSGVGSLNSLLEALLTLSLPGDDQREEIDLNALVREQISSLEPLAKENSVEIKPNLDDSTTILVEGNRYALGRAFYNLIENGIKYAGGVIDISTKKSDEGGIVITISDNGPGIPSEHIPRIFDRFYRADKSRSRSLGGFGLGLAIVRKVIEDHGGKISVKNLDNWPGKSGAQFEILFRATL